MLLDSAGSDPSVARSLTLVVDSIIRSFSSCDTDIGSTLQISFPTALGGLPPRY